MEEVKLTPKRIQSAIRTYEEVLKERARQIVVMKDELGWSFERIGKEFGISRQAVQVIYKNSKAENGAEEE